MLKYRGTATRKRQLGARRLEVPGCCWWIGVTIVGGRPPCAAAAALPVLSGCSCLRCFVIACRASRILMLMDDDPGTTATNACISISKSCLKVRVCNLKEIKARRPSE